MPAVRAQSWQTDTTFAPVLEGSVPVTDPLDIEPQYVVQPASNGKLMVRVDYAINGILTYGVPRRLNPDGSLDTTFQPPIATPMNLEAVYKDGRVIMRSSTTFTRYLATGALDAAFKPVQMAFSNFPTALALDDGRVLIFGDTSLQVNGTNTPSLAMLNADGTLSTAFRPTFSMYSSKGVTAVLPLANGKFMVAGNFTAINGITAQALARLNADGSVDTSFSSSAAGQYVPASVILPSSNSEIIIGTSTSFVKFTASGSVDTSFGTQNLGSVQKFGPEQSDGHIFYLTNDGSSMALRRVNADGTIDGSFVITTPSPNTISYSAAAPVITDDGSVYVPSALTAARALSNRGLTRVHNDATIDAGFNPRVSKAGLVYHITIQSDGRRLIDGVFSFVNNAAVSTNRMILRLNADGSTDTKFAVAPLAQYTLYEFAVQPSGKVLAWGGFQTASGQRAMIRLNPDGSLDTGFNFPATAAFPAAVDANGLIYISGFDHPTTLARYSVDGVLDQTFTVTTPAKIADILPRADGSVVILEGDGGSSSMQVFVRVLSSGLFDPTYNVTSPGFQEGEAILPDGSVATVSSADGSPADYTVSRINSTGNVDYTYTWRTVAGQPGGDAWVLAGSLYDLLGMANSSTSAVVQGRFNQVANWIGVTARGKLNLTSTLGGPLESYQRAAVSGPTVNPNPVFLQSISGTNTAGGGEPIVLSVVCGGLSPSYVWKKDGVPLAGFNSPILRIPQPSASDSGVYTVTVSNSYGSITSSGVSVQVYSGTPATIISPPQSTAAAVGKTVTFSVAATGSPSVSYQWSFNGGRIPRATGPTLSLTNIQLANAGTYSVYVSNVFGSNVSTVYANAVLTVTSFAPGTYFGKIGSDDVAATIRPDGTADLLLNLASAGRLVLATGVAVAVDGSFSAAGFSYRAGQNPTTGSAVTINGTFTANGTMTGAIVGEAVSFSALKTSDNLDGFYQAKITGENFGLVAAITDSTGAILAVADEGGVLLSGVNHSANATSVLLSGNGGTLTATVDLSAGTLAGTGIIGGAAVSTAGVRGDIMPTDLLADISTRARVGTGDSTLVAGFVVSGSVYNNHPVLIRAVGPTLKGYGISDALSTPHLTIFSGQTVVISGDAWGAMPQPADISNAALQVGAFALPTGSADAAMLVNLHGGAYTATVTSDNGSGGVALIEVYDAGMVTNPGMHLLDISSRGIVGTGDNSLLAGFVVTGNRPKRVLVRGIGPGLIPFGVGNTVADPVLTLLAGQTQIATNDDWSTRTDGVSAADISAAATSVGAFSLTSGSTDAAILITLNPGLYSAVLSHKGDTDGVGLVEVYEVP